MARNMNHNAGDPDRCDYVVRVEWDRTLPREDAFWEQDLFANQNTATTMRHTRTIERLEDHFGLEAEPA